MRTSPFTHRPVRLILDFVGLVLLVLAAYVTATHLWDVINFYDEGLLLTGARLVSKGLVPYRDFYANYPPGIFFLIAGLWKLTGVRAIALRYLGLAMHLALAALAARLAGRVSGRRMVPLAGALVLCHTIVLGVGPFAYVMAVVLALGACELWLSSQIRPSTVRLVAVGVLLGLVAAFRHDVFIQVSLALGLVGAVDVARRRSLPDAASMRRLAIFGLGLAIPLAITWLPTFTQSGYRVVANDLYFDQVRYTMPARVLPFPSFWPGSLDKSFPASLCLVLAGPFLAVAAALWIRGRSKRWPAILLGCLAVVLVVPSLGRCDAYHVAFGVAPAVILACGLMDRAASQVSVRTALLAILPAAWLVTAAIEPLRKPTTGNRSGKTNPVLTARPLPMVKPAARAVVLSFIALHTTEQDPIFVGAFSHRHVMANEMDLYFLADRRPAVRRSQFDPNVVTIEKFQREMISELEKSRPKVAILTACCTDFEPNASSQPGSGLLDDYLRKKYDLAKATPLYMMLLRRPDDPEERR